MDRAIRVLIADDHEVVREGLRALISTRQDMEVVGEATDGDDAVAKARLLRPDVILLDLVMPRKGGVEAMREIRAENPTARVLILTSFSEDDLVLAAIQSGATGYLLKDSSRQDLMRAIQEVSLGRPYLHPSLTMRVVRRLETLEQARADEKTLTEREIEVLLLVARGLTNQEIGDALCITERTAAKHVGLILDKLHLRNRTEAALWALRQGIARLYPPDNH